MYSLPGGHVKLGEATTDGLVRAYKEETIADIPPIRLLWTEECFWECDGRKTHNLDYNYLIELCDGSEIPDTGEFAPHKDNSNVVIGWMPIENLKNIIIYPEFLRSKIYKLDNATEHIITK